MLNKTNITKVHSLSIVVNGEELEIENQDSLNLRINNTVYSPEKTKVTQSEYSFSFDVPQSPKNNRIFGFANVPSIKGKFTKTFSTYVYADNIEIFNGVLRISSIGEGKYKCNLISVKNSSIDEIFGESKMNEITWGVPYDGTDTQNAINAMKDPDYFFPLVCYGAFQKDPYMYLNGESTTMQYYTSPMILDKWTKFYNETFVPSPKIIELIKRMIEQKGYTYSGNVFTDEIINKLYLSSYISDGQDPPYNLGGKRGQITVSTAFFSDGYQGRSPMGANTIVRELQYPEDYHYLEGDDQDSDMPFQTADIYQLWTNHDGVLTQNNDDMWENGNIVIPHTGYYKITMECDVVLMQSGAYINDSYPIFELSNPKDINSWELVHEPFKRKTNLDELSFDVQLVKNGDMNMEFITGNRQNALNNPIWATDRHQPTNLTDYPHETPLTELGGRVKGGSWRDSGSNIYQYYYQPKHRTRAYDPKVNPNFVMGLSTGTNSFSVIKNGRSWDKSVGDENKSNFYCLGYSKYSTDYSSNYITNINDTDYQDNRTNVPQCDYTALSSRQIMTKGYAVVWLEKGDMLTLRAMHPQYKVYADRRDDGVITYTKPRFDIYSTIKVEAFSPYEKDLKRDWFKESAFSKDLNIGNFLNKEELQKDFFENFLTTFNLSCNVTDNNIDINTNVQKLSTSEAVEVDNRVDLDSVQTEIIDFPTSIEVKWTTDDEESGFYHSVSDEHINDDDWKDWAETGSEKIKLIRNQFSKNEISKTSKFSYTWMMPFTLSDCYMKAMIPSQGGGGGSWEKIFHLENQDFVLNLPIIAKDEDFIDGGDYEEMMKKDGRGLKQRLWFKDETTSWYVPNRNGSTYDDDGNLQLAKDYILICTPTNLYNGKEVLKYTNEKDSLLMRYFNVNLNTDSNYATVEVYLTPQEYLMLKNGAMVRFDNDRYRVCVITGYDPTANNKTKLKLMKM